MNIKQLFCAGMILFSFMACNRNEEMDNTLTEGNGEKAYVSLAISMPNGTAGTKAGEETEAGTKEEQNNQLAGALLRRERYGRNR